MISLKTIYDCWDRFFFEPKPTEGIALFRIVWITVLIFYFLFDLPNLADFYGPHALISLETSREHFRFPHVNVFNWLGNSYNVVYILVGIYGLALLSSLFGFFTRSSLLIVLVCLVSLHQRNIWLLSSSELLIRAITILLVCSPCGHTLSLDAYFAQKREGRKLPREWAPWALRLIQIQLSVVYVWTVWHKLKGDDWLDGTALYYATRLESMTNFPVPYLMNSIWFIKISTWGTLLLELSLGTLIWIKEFRKPLILTGIGFHLGIEYIMSIPFFEIVMMVLLINFFTPEELKSFVLRMKSWLVRNISEVPMADKAKTWLISLIGEEKSS